MHQLIDRNKNYASAENIILGLDYENYQLIEQVHTRDESSPYKNQHSEPRYLLGVRSDLSVL